jgi:hypothetical protein
MMINKRPGRSIKFNIGASILLTATIGTALAANFAIGAPNINTEFGQGVYSLKACDSWIQLNVVAGPTGTHGAPAGFSALTGVSIEGLDATTCANTKFTIGAIGSAGENISIYRTDNSAYLCSENSCVPESNSQTSFALTISDSSVVSLEKTDGYHSLSYNNQSGVYTVNFQQPAVLASDVAQLTIQSSGI